MTTITANFDLDSWDETTIDESAGARILSIEITKT